MIEIIPAILPKNYEDLKNTISLVKGMVPIVQIDICDGIFVETVTWPFNVPKKEDGSANLDSHFVNILNEQEGMPFWEDINFELDLMVSDAVKNFDVYTKLSPKKIIFHIEAIGDLENFKDFLEGIDMYIRDSIEIGIAINPSTPIEQIFSIANYIDFVQFMGNDKIGYQGVELDENVYDKIKDFKKKHPKVKISVDIGVNFKTAPKLIKAGVRKLVSGSTIYESEDIEKAIKKLKSSK